MTTNWEYLVIDKSQNSLEIRGADYDAAQQAAITEPGATQYTLLKRAGELGWELVAVGRNWHWF